MRRASPLLLGLVLLFGGWLLWGRPKNSLASSSEGIVEAHKLVSVRDFLRGHFGEGWAMIEPTLTGFDLSQMVDPSLVPPWDSVESIILAAITLSEDQLDGYRIRATAWDNNRQVLTDPEHLATAWDSNSQVLTAPEDLPALNPSGERLSSIQIKELRGICQPYTDRLDELGFLQGALVQKALYRLWEEQGYLATPFVALPTRPKQGSRFLTSFTVCTHSYNVVFPIYSAEFPEIASVSAEIQSFKEQRMVAGLEYMATLR